MPKISAAAANATVPGVSHVFLSWNAYGYAILSNGSVWEFETVLWARQGNFAWNGTESIRGRSTWGRLVFELPASARTAILRHRIFTVLATYQAEKATRAEHAGILDYWQNPVLGDPEFYHARVKPLVEKLDALVPLVKPGMSDEDVARVAAARCQAGPTSATRSMPCAASGWSIGFPSEGKKTGGAKSADFRNRRMRPPPRFKTRNTAHRERRVLSVAWRKPTRRQ